MVQQVVTFDQMFKILGGDLPLSFYSDVNKYHLQHMRRKRDKHPDEITSGEKAGQWQNYYITAHGLPHTLATWDDEIAAIEKFEFVLAKVCGPAVDEPYWPYPDSLSSVIEHVRWIYHMNEFEREIFEDITFPLSAFNTEPASIFDAASNEHWLVNLLNYFTSPIKNKKAQAEITRRIALETSNYPDKLSEALGDTVHEVDALRKVWKLREVWHAHQDNEEYALHHFWKSYGCAEGKGNAAEKAIKALGLDGYGGE